MFHRATRLLLFACLAAALSVIHVSPAAAQAAPPAPWTGADIGSVGLAGSATVDSSGTFTVTGSGADIWGSADQFHFEYVELPYDGYIEARITGVEGTQAWAKAGVMIRKSLAPNSAHYSFFVTPGNGAVHQFRMKDGGASTNWALSNWGINGAPVYVRMWRQSEFVSMSVSGDGQNWIGVPGDDWGMGTVYVGLSVTSHTNTQRATGTIDHINVVVGPPNQPSQVAITQPADGQVFNSPASVPFTITASDPDYGIKEVNIEMLFGDQWSVEQTFYTSDGYRSPYTGQLRQLYTGTYHIRSRVVDNQNGITYSDPVSFTVTDGSLSGQWQDADIGATGATGSFADGDPIVVKGAGADIWGTADAFHYAYQQVTGDWETVVRVGSIDNAQAWTKAGIMFRESLSPGSKHVSWFATAQKGLALQVRRADGGVSYNTSGPIAYAPIWLRLVRRGNTFSAYYRYLGDQGWQLVATDSSVTLPDTVYVGMAVTSHQAGTLATATFDSVQSASVSWTSTDVGSVGAAGSVADHGSSVSVDGSGADIWGTADAFQFYHRGWMGDGAIVARVRSLENTNAWAKAGVMFRESVSASSKQVSIFVTPGKGIAMQYRLATGGQSYNAVLTSGTIPKWVRLIRHGDQFVGGVSDDGLHWTDLATMTVSMNAAVETGLAVTSHAAGTLATAVFDSPSVER